MTIPDNIREHTHKHYTYINCHPFLHNPQLFIIRNEQNKEFFEYLEKKRQILWKRYLPSTIQYPMNKHMRKSPNQLSILFQLLCFCLLLNFNCFGNIVLIERQWLPSRVRVTYRIYILFISTFVSLLFRSFWNYIHFALWNFIAFVSFLLFMYRWMSLQSSVFMECE